MASSIQSNPVYYSLASLSSAQNPSSRTVVLHKRSDHDGFGVYIGEDIPSGLYIVTVERDSPASDANIQPGDRVLAVNGQLVSSMSTNPKETLMKAASNAESLTLTIQSTDLLQTLDIPSKNNYKDNNNHSKKQNSSKQTLGLNSDLENYIKSLFADENVQILQTSNNNEFIFKSDPYATSSKEFNSFPDRYYKTSGQKKQRRHHHHHHHHNHSKRTPQETKQTQTSFDNDRNENMPQGKLQPSPVRQHPTHPSVGTSEHVLRTQQPTPSDNSSLGSLGSKSSLTDRNSDFAPIPIRSPPNNVTRSSKENTHPPPPQQQHMADVVQAAVTASHKGKQPNNHEQISSRHPPENTTHQPAPTSRDPAPTARNPAPTSRDPAPTSRDPAPTSRDPAPTARNPAPTSRDPAPTSRDPAPTSRDPAPASRDPAPTSRDPAPTSRDPAPASRDPAPASRDPAPTSRDPAPASRDPAPTSRDPAPASRDSAPTSRDPAPASRDPAPTSRDPAPASRDPAPTSRDPAPLAPRTTSPPPYTETEVANIPPQPVHNQDSGDGGSYNVRNAEENQQAASRGDGLREVHLHRSPDFQGFGFHLQYNKAYFLVQRIEPDSPAQQAGLHANDVIHSINGQITENMPHGVFVETVNANSDIDFLVQTFDEYVRANPPPVRNPQMASAVAAAINTDNDKRKTGLSKALGKLSSR